MKTLIYIIMLTFLLGVNPVRAYPLDGAEYTGIMRLEGYRLAQEGKARARRLHPGALLGIADVDLRLKGYVDLELPAVDKEFKQQILDILGNQAKRYSISILDLTDRNFPIYAEHRADKNFNPGSIGKLVVAIAVFHELAKAFPDDLELRRAVLQNAEVKADEFIRKDHHKAPFWNGESNRMIHRPVRIGDRASLWTYLDWMLSASSNAAASMSMKHLMLLHHYKSAYPTTEQEENDYFSKTKPAQLAQDLRDALDGALQAQGVNIDEFRQGGFFTREGKRRVPTGGSKGSTRELLKLLLRLEQGGVVDEFSSREIKRLLYMTQKRIRYASSPALKNAAVYFKSGSLYKCRPEEGFECRKYMGNKLNLLNSVAIVESPAGAKDGLFYMVVVTSNILKRNAAVEHQTLATRIHRLMEKRHSDRLQRGGM